MLLIVPTQKIQWKNKSKTSKKLSKTDNIVIFSGLYEHKNTFSQEIKTTEYMCIGNI